MRDATRIDIDDEYDVLKDRDGRELVLEVLDREFNLMYVGLNPGT